MKISKNTVFTILALAVIAAGSFYVYDQKRTPATVDYNAIAATADEAIATASFYDLDEKVQPLAQWKGKVLVVNFWGTWCPPCREEIPEFIRYQKQHAKDGVLFVGIAIDQKNKVQAYAKEIGMNYPSLLGDLAGIDLAKRIGNTTGGLPYTVIVDRNGKVQTVHVGKMNFEMLEAGIKPLL
jgi:thiol-disulfide isomerase/thioredoxin